MATISRHQANRNVSAPDPKAVLAGLLRLAGLDETMLGDIALTGAEPALPSSFAVSTAAQAAIAAAALAAARCGGCARGGGSASASTCATPRSNFAASGIYASTGNIRLMIQTG
jgi:hypothetical protein